MGKRNKQNKYYDGQGGMTMKKRFLIVVVLFALVSCLWGFDWAEKQENGTMVFGTENVKEIENYLNVKLEDCVVITKKCDNSDIEGTPYLMIIHDDKTWEVVTFTKDFMFVFVSETI